MNEIIDYNNRIYKEKKYSKSEWFLLMNSFSVMTDEKITLKKVSVVDIKQVKKIFELNIKKYTFLGLVLPVIVFAITSIISVFVGVLLIDNNEYINVCYFSFFTSMFFFLIAILLFIKLIKKDKCYLSYVCHQARYVHITFTKYQEMISFFDKNIKN